MSAKNLDKHNRWRNKTVAFRVSPEEDTQIETAVKLTGLTKQDYIIRRLLCRDVVVQGNPRVYKALRDQLAAVLDELRRIEAGQSVNDELLDTIQMIATIMNGMQRTLPMTDEKKKMTAQNSSVGADDGQSISQNSKFTIPDPDEKSNSPERDLEELYRKMRRMSDPFYLHTVTLDELMDNVFEGKSAVIENLLYTGAYILAGAPKIGKSFLVAQIAHHVSTGQDLWGYKVHQGTVLYLALEDDESRLQRRMFRMFGVEGT